MQYSTVPTSSITAEVVTVDGFALAQKDTAGVVTTFTRSHHLALWYITWDPTQQNATRPLALQKDGAWHTYGWGKRIMEWNGAFAYGVLASRARAHVILLVML